ncbi:DUF1289 domain-containing protein [Pseudoalteromonas sp. MMG012]|uniref:DUF1289 domain-containing protein n=1 Tax=Pseudoalteromonas sp. MMG012 TaxID=2822686 RepID=UPI001B3A3FA3|nr:DUF1289 domain-containing protein [Pseudoalteromonas sp. MMG012]MBQ4852633.1 DUF1289 domain-containing protein [Pseudoalteromonas sp. MMG012]
MVSVKYTHSITLTQSIDIPCVRRCCLDNNDVCIGCYRTLQEILDWHELSTEQKHSVIQQCNQRKLSCER